MGDTPPGTRARRTFAARTGRRVTPLLAAVGAVLAAGCSLQPGQDALDDFTTWHAEHPLAGMSSDTATVNDVLPGIGNATVLITSDGSATPEQALEHYCAYTSATPVYFHLQYPAQAVTGTEWAGQVTVPLPCDDPDTFQRPTRVENLDGLESAGLTDTPHLSFTTPRTLAAGLRTMQGHYDAREMTASTDGLYVSLEAAADPAAAAAAADIVDLAPKWPIKHLVLNAGSVNYPAVLNAQVTGSRRRIQAEINRIASEHDVPAKYAINVVSSP